MKALISAMIALAATTTVVQAETRAPAQPAPGAAMTRAEMQSRAEEAFARMDINKDGKLDASDRAGRRDAVFAAMDTDKNGQISREEMAKAREARAGMEHGDQGPAAGPGHSMKGGPGGHQMGRMADTNRDRVVSKAEFMAMANARFNAADTNNDGVVTAAERQAARAKAQAAKL